MRDRAGGIRIPDSRVGGRTLRRKIARDAAAYNQRHPDYGYEGDPFRPVEDRYYGYLINAGIY